MCDMTTKPEGIVRLGRAVRDRRTELRMTQDDVARAGGPSDVTVRNLESASVSRINAATLGKLDVALQWEPGTSSAHLQGTAEQPVGTAPAPVLLHDASDSALLAEIARRFDLTRSSRESASVPAATAPAPNRDDLADPAQPHGATRRRRAPLASEEQRAEKVERLRRVDLAELDAEGLRAVQADIEELDRLPLGPDDEAIVKKVHDALPGSLATSRADWVRADPRPEDFDRAADDSGPSLLEADDARAARRGEESQDPEDWT